MASVRGRFLRVIIMLFRRCFFLFIFLGWAVPARPIFPAFVQFKDAHGLRAGASVALIILAAAYDIGAHEKKAFLSRSPVQNIPTLTQAKAVVSAIADFKRWRALVLECRNAIFPAPTRTLDVVNEPARISFRKEHKALTGAFVVAGCNTALSLLQGMYWMRKGLLARRGTERLDSHGSSARGEHDLGGQQHLRASNAYAQSLASPPRPRLVKRRLVFSPERQGHLPPIAEEPSSLWARFRALW